MTHIRNALAMGELCSNDPVCSQHNPQSQHECRFLHGAACHGCLLIAETSCEQHNELLDRALVVPNGGQSGRAVLPMADTMTTQLLTLADTDLQGLATALRSGRLVTPFTGIAVQRVAPPRLADALPTNCKRWSPRASPRTDRCAH